MMESLSDKLKSLNVHLGAGNIPRPQPRPSYAIEQVIPGRTVATLFGEAYIVEKNYALDYRHGLVDLCAAAPLSILSAWGRANHLAECPLSNFVFLDTETTGLSGGTGTLVFLVGLGHIAGDGFHLTQLLLREPQEERAMLAALGQFLDPFQAVVTYNGKAFDIPLLNTRHIQNVLESPFGRMAHLDLLPLARRVWRNRLASRTLGNLEVEILGVARSGEEVPGWMIPEIYFEYRRSGDARPLEGVLYHNAMDILSLAGVFQHSAALLADPLGYGVPHSLDTIAIARLYEELGLLEQAVMLYEFSLQAGLPEEFFVQTLQRFAELHKRQSQWEQTILLWQKASQHHHIESCVELAKYYEHRARQFEDALQWTETAIQLVEQYVSGRTSQKIWIEELRRRQDRIRRKLSR